MVNLTSKNADVYDQHYSYELIENDSIVFCTLQGYITKDFLSEIMSEHKKRLDKLRAKGKPALLITDITRVTGISSEARRAVSLFRNFEVDRSAIIGAGPITTLFARYTIRLIRTSKQYHIFRTKRGAIDWLKGKLTPPRIVLARVFASIIMIAGLTALIGWALDIQLLQTLGHSTIPVDPLTSINLIVISLALLLLAVRKKALAQRILVRVCATWLILFGLVGLANNLLSMPLVESLTLSEPTLSNNIRFLILFLLVGLLLWQATYPLVRKWPSTFFRFTMIPAVVGTLIFISTNAFGTIPIYSMGVALIFLAIEIALVLITFRKPGRFPVARFVVLRYWQGIIVFVIIFGIFIIVWHAIRSAQENVTLERTARAIETQAITDFSVLYEYRAFFNASEFISEEEFRYYLAEATAHHRDSGITGVQFIEAAPNGPYTLLYADSKNEALPIGLDFTSDAQAKQLLDNARDSGTLESKHIDLTALPGRSGVFNLSVLAVYTPGLAVPNTISERTTELQGFVAAEFDAKAFIRHLVDSTPIENGVALTITDHESGDVLYRSPSVSRTVSNPDVLNMRSVPIAGTSWDVSTLRNNFGSGSPFGPNIILLAGGLISALISAIVISVIQRRYRVQQLVNAVSIDIQQERDRAMSLALKDDALIESVGDGLVVTDHAGVVTRVNERFTELTGWYQNDLLGKEFMDVVTMLNPQGERIPHFKRPLYRALNNKSHIEQTTALKDKFRYVRKDGTDFPAAITVAPVIIDGKVTGAIETFRDITKEVEIDRAKTEFVSLAAHQLRTPLTATKWYTELLISDEAGGLTPRQMQYAQEAHKGTNRTIQLVNSLLNVSRVEAGSATVDPQPTDLRAFIQKVVEDYSQQISERKLQVTEQFDHNLPKVNVDLRLMQIIVVNLLSNAIKYTPEEGTITITLRKDHHGILFAVTDTGYGIPQSQQSMIFSKLFRADNIKIKNTEGTGLGLYLVKSIIEYTGGQIWFESTENVGSTFSVHIPYRGMSRRSGTTSIVNVEK